MTTDAEVQTVIFIPVRRHAKPGPDGAEEVPELEPQEVEEVEHGATPIIRQPQKAHRS